MSDTAQGIAASLDRVASAKQQKAAAVHADVEEGGIKAHQTKAIEQDRFYKVTPVSWPFFRMKN